MFIPKVYSRLTLMRKEELGKNENQVNFILQVYKYSPLTNRGIRLRNKRGKKVKRSSHRRFGTPASQ